MNTPKLMEMEECTERNKKVLNKFFETDQGQKYIPIVESIKNSVVATMRSKGFENLVITKAAVSSLYVIIVDTEGSGTWLGSLSRQLSDPPKLVAYNLAYSLFKGDYTKR